VPPLTSSGIISLDRRPTPDSCILCRQRDSRRLGELDSGPLFLRAAGRPFAPAWLIGLLTVGAAIIPFTERPGLKDLS